LFNKAIKTLAVIKGWWWWIFPPTLVLMSIFLSLYIMTVGLDEISNPRLKKITGE
jgi:peptide/nickel transport system permease protein